MSLWRDVLGSGSSGTAAAGGAASGFASVLDSVRGVRWHARSAVRGGIPGAHASRLRGMSAEFTEYRPYRQGDDLRRIDWKLLARSDRAYVRLSNDRAVLPTTVVLDASASMAFPVDALSKWKLASELAVGLCAIARNSGDPVGLAIPHDSFPVILRPRTRQGVMQELIRTVAQLEPSGSAAMTPAVALAAQGSGRIAIVSDFLGDLEDLLSTSARWVAAGCEVHAVHIVAREEIDPPHGRSVVADPEVPELRRPMDADARSRYVAAFSEWREQLARSWSDAGVSYTLGVTGTESTDHLIRRITQLRRA